MFQVGNVVVVESRTWPGINQAGGVARVIGAAEDRVSVRYVLDGRIEKEIEDKYVQQHTKQIESGRTLRDRAILLGRCTHCGSLRRDCGSCGDHARWISASAYSYEHPHPHRHRQGASITGTGNARPSGGDSDTQGSLSDTSWDNAYVMMQKRLRRMKRNKAVDFIESTSTGSSSVSSTSTRTGSSSSSDAHGAGGGKRTAPSPSDDDSDSSRDELLLKKLMQSLATPSSSKQRRGRRKLPAPTEQPNNQLSSSLRHRRLATMMRRRGNLSHKSVLETLGDTNSSQSADPATVPAAAAAANDVHEDGEFFSGSDSSSGSASSGGSSGSSSSSRSFEASFAVAAATYDDVGSVGTANMSQSSSSPIGALPPRPAHVDLTKTMSQAQVDNHNDLVSDENSVGDRYDGSNNNEENKVAFTDLPRYIDSLMDDLEHEQIPEAKQRVSKLKKKIKQQSKRRTLAGLAAAEHLKSLKKECDSLHEALTRTLIQERVDRCQAALKRSEKRQLYRASKPRMTAAQVADFKSHKRELRDMRFHAIHVSVEQVMRKLRMLQSDLDDELAELEEEELQQQSDCHEHFAESMNEEKLFSPNRSGSPGLFLGDDNGEPYLGKPSSSSPIVPQNHVHAQRRRTNDQRNRPEHQLLKRSSKLSRSRKDSFTNRNLSKRKQSQKAVESHTTKRARKAGSGAQCPRISRKLVKRKKRKPYDRITGAVGPIPSNSAGSDHLLFISMRGLDGDDAEEQDVAMDSDGGPLDIDDDTMHQIEEESSDEAVPGMTDIAFGRKQYSRSTGGRKKKAGCNRNYLKRLQEYFSIIDPSLATGIGMREFDPHRYSGSRSKSASNVRESSSPIAKSMARPSPRNDLFADETQALPEAAQTAHDQVSHRRMNPGKNGVSRIGSTSHLADPARQFISEVAVHCNRMAAEMTNDEGAAVERFKTIHGFLVQFGAPTIQELIARRSELVFSFCRLLGLAIEMIHSRENEALRESDGILSELFGTAAQDRFIEFVTLNAVESLVSISNPTAWSLTTRDADAARRGVVQLLSSLRHFGSLLERVNRCFTQTLSPQKWRLDKSGGFAFVSSMDPVQWREYLASANTCVVAGGESRYQHIGDRLPRSEIESIWCLLGVVAAMEPTANSDKPQTWGLLTRVLTEGIFQDDFLAPPCSSHCTACVQQLNMLTSLLSSGCLDGSVFQDSLLLSVLWKALSLEACSLQLNEKSRVMHYPSVVDGCRDKDLVSRGWFRGKQDAGTQTPYTSSHLSRDLLEGSARDLFMGIPVLLPSSSILLACLSLVSVWTEKMPTQQSRRKRLSRNLLALVEKFAAEKHDVELGFGTAFCTTEATKGGLGCHREKLFREESAVFIKLVYCLASRLVLGRASGDVHLKKGESKFVDMGWKALADEQMISHVGGSITSEQYSGDGLRLLAAARVCILQALLCNGSFPVTCPLEAARVVNAAALSVGDLESKDVDCLILRAVTCLKCSLSVRANTEVTSSIILCFVSYLKGSRDRSLTQQVRVGLSEIFAKLLRRLLSASFCGTEEGLCMESMLLALHEMLLNVAAAEKDVVLHRNNKIGFGDVGATPSESDPYAKALQQICKTIVYAIIKSRPASRTNSFTLPARGGESERPTLSRHGQMLVTRHHQHMCKCVVEIVALNKSHWSSDLAKEIGWLLEHISSAQDGAATSVEDDTYIGQVITSLVLELSEFLGNVYSISAVFADNWFALLVRSIRSMLDYRTLLGMPSSNFTRLRIRAGIEVAVVEFERCHRLPPVGSRSPTLEFVHVVGKGIAEACPASTLPSRVAEVLVNPPTGPELKLEPSVERECFDRFVLLQKLSTTILQCPEWSEKFLQAVFTASVQNLLDASSRPSTTFVVQATETEAFLAFAELQIALLAYLTESRARAGLIHDSSIFDFLWDSVISSILGDSHHATEKSLAGVSGSLPSSNDANSCHRKSNRLANYEGLLDIVVRYSRSWVIAIALDFHRSGGWHAKAKRFYDALVETATTKGKPICLIVAKSFCTCTASVSVRSQSHLSIALFNYFESLEQSTDGPKEVTDALLALKRYTLFHELVPNLSRRMHPKATMVFIRNLLRAETSEVSNLTDESPRLNMRDLRKLVQELHLSIQSAMVSSHYELVVVAIETVRSLLSLPAACVAPHSVGSLWNWCKEQQSTLSSRTRILESDFILSFCSWLVDFGKDLITGHSTRLTAKPVGTLDRGTKSDAVFQPSDDRLQDNPCQGQKADHCSTRGPHSDLIRTIKKFLALVK